MIEWLTLKQVSNEWGFKDTHTRTFINNYMDQYPPDRVNKHLKWWKQSTVDYIKENEFPDRTKKN